MTKQTKNEQGGPKEPKMIIYEYVDQQNSTFMLQGSDGVFLCAPAKAIIPSTSIEVTDGGEHNRIRFIHACSYIEFDKQQENKIQPSALGADVISFEAGKLILLDRGPGKTMSEYLDRSVLSEDNKGKKDGVKPLYRKIIKEVEAQKSIDDFFTKKKLFDFLGTLLIQPTGKNGVTKFKEEKIDYLCAMFNIIGFDHDAYKEKLEALIAVGSGDPDKFLEKIADELAAVDVTVKLAIQNGIANFDGLKFVFTEGPKLIVAVKSKKPEDKIKEVTEYLLSPDGFKDYQKLNLDIKHHNENLNLQSKLADSEED